jgi:hypothetical protein
MSSTSPTSTSGAATVPVTTTEAGADVKSKHALSSLKTNYRYLLDPSKPDAPRPGRLRTRAFLRVLRFSTIFIFWRIVRYAKYALVGTVVAALGATALGGAVTGVGWILAPPGILASVGIGAVWAAGKWGLRKMHVGQRVETAAEIERRRRHEDTKREGSWRDVQGPRAVPW